MSQDQRLKAFKLFSKQATTECVVLGNSEKKLTVDTVGGKKKKAFNRYGPLFP